MRRKVSSNARPFALLLLLTGIISARASVSSPFDSLGALPRSVVYPSQHLEEGVYAADEATRKFNTPSGRRRMMPLSEDPFQMQVNGFRFKGSDVVRTISDSGGSLQLLLLLVLCAAVLCCASMSISPWYKSDSYILRKAMAALYALAAFLSDISIRSTNQQGCEVAKQEQVNRISSERPGKGGQAQVEKASSRKAKSKRRKGAQSSSSPLHPAEILHRPLEKTGSGSNSSIFEVSSVHSGDVELDALAREDRLAGHATPADIQIARLQAEAARQSSQRAARSKQNGRRQVAESAQVEPQSASRPAAGSSSDGVRKLDSASVASTSTDKSERISAGRKSTSKEQAHSKLARPAPGESDASARDRLGRRVNSAAKSGPRLSQVLVVPRRPAARGKDRLPHRSSASDDERDSLLAPGTPERSPSATFSSLQPNAWSPSNPSRPYAQVAKENSYGHTRPKSSAVPPPPPPPPPPPLPHAAASRVSALPQTAVFAREFQPASQSPRPSLNAAAPAFSPNPRPSSSVAPPPAHVAYLDIRSPDRPHPTSSPLPSPFPGMSLHRRMVSPSSQPSPPPLAASDLALPPTGSMSSQGSNAVYKGLGFPGVVDTIWSRNAVGAASSWLPAGIGQAVLGSFDSGKEPSSSPNDSELVTRQDSW